MEYRAAAGPGVKQPTNLQSGNTIKIKVGWEEQKANEDAFSYRGEQRLICSLSTHALQDVVPGLHCSWEKSKGKGLCPFSFKNVLE